MPVYATDKPLGLSSHDVVARARRVLSTRRVGHTGTLDPLATGVLVLCVGESTKLVQFLEPDSKDYLAWVSFGAATETLDAEGPISEVAEVSLQPAEVEAALPALRGSYGQIPPQYSALQVGGQRAYDVARRGGSLDLPARQVTVHELELLGLFPSLEAAPKTFQPDGEGRWQPSDTGRAFTLPLALGDFPTALLWARVGSGTYLRALARDLGAALGLPAHLSGLVRTRVGRFGLERAVPWEDLASATPTPDLAALPFPVIEADDALARTLLQGKRPASALTGRFTVTHAGRLLAVVDGDGQQLRVVRAWA